MTISVSLKNKIKKQIKRIEEIIDYSLAVSSISSSSFIAIQNVLNDLKKLIKDDK